MRETARVTALARALLGVVGVLLGLLAATRGAGPVAWGSALLAFWLCAASLIRYFGIGFPQPASEVSRLRLIPLGFSGPTGRFSLRPRGDGRKVEVTAGSEIVAEVLASDLRDEIIIDYDAVEDGELPDLGIALGQAIEMAAAADEDGADP